MKRIIVIAIAFLTLLNTQAQNSEKAAYLDVRLDFETRATDLVNQMTLDEKISQLGNNAPAITRLGIEKYDWWNEGLHGVARAGKATVFPQAIGMAASFDTDLMFKVADIISTEGRAKHHEALRNKNYDRYFGLTYWSPNINIFRDPRWGRGHETYGEDPYLTGQMGIQFVNGLQGNDSKYIKLVATAKHFAVHNGPEPERHFFNVTPNSRDLWETYLPAFEDLMVKSKAYSIMGAYNRVDGESASASWMLLEDILRNKWGFKGYVVSDCGAIRDIHAFHKIVNTPEEAAAIGVRRGCDLNCGGVYQSALKKAVEMGLIDEGEIDLSVYRLMLAKMKLGMFDPTEIVPYAQIPFEVNESEAHSEVALIMAQKSMTLLKNNGILPLDKKKIKRIAVVGPNADNIEALRGNYYGDASNPVSVIDGIKKAVGNNVKVTYSEGVSLVIPENKRSDYSLVEGKYLFTKGSKGEKIEGLFGEYFNNRNLEGEAVFSRVDSQIKFNWKQSPTDVEVAQGILTADKAIGNDEFSIRWTGNLVAPKTGKYELGVESDDGCRIWINGEKIADGWFDHGMLPFLGEIELVKGKTYKIKIEYYEGGAEAGINLFWKIPGKNKNQKMDDPFSLSKNTLEDVKNADVAIFVGGLDATWEGEEMSNRKGVEGFNGGDRIKIELPEIQLKALKAMKETGTPVIFVLMSGSAIAFEGLEKELDAILMAWYPGQRGGDAVADVLLGDYNPAGRLPVTFYKSTNELADFKDYNMRAGKGFTYRYYNGEALFPFGHGLSYTNFEYSNLEIEKTTLSSSDTLTVSVKIKNDGKLDGEEVVQLYVKDVKSDKWMAIKQLRKFERISLKKGEEKTIEFKLNIAEDMRYYNSMSREYEVEPGEFNIMIGKSSANIVLQKTIEVKKN